MAQDPVSRPAPDAARRWRLQLPKDAPAARTARTAVGEWLAGAPAEATGAARSVVTELVSNAVRFGRAPIGLSVEDLGDRIRIEVDHAGTGRSRARFQPRTRGRGLQIVAAQAESWGTNGDLSHVWAELRVPGRPDG
jgi:anti-sigma regulatory factor (Ser/Thr protein kinase)